MPRIVLPVLAALALATALWAPPAARAEDGEPPSEEARKAAVDAIRKDLRRLAASPRTEKTKPEIQKALDSLEALGGPEAGRAALEAVAHPDPEVRDRAFGIAEKERGKDLVKPLADLLEDKRFKRDFDVHRRVAHALAIVADVGGIEPLTGLLLSDDGTVVAAAADALGTFASAPHRHRVEPVRRMIDLYESTWNLMNSIRPEDRVAAKQMKDRWEAYGKPLRLALQALTRETLTRPAEWRRWWNDHKKDETW